MSMNIFVRQAAAVQCRGHSRGVSARARPLRTEIVARDLYEAGVTLWYYGTGEQERLDTPEGRFVLAARSFAAELERAKTKERTRDAHASRAQKGYVTGGVVYGYKNAQFLSALTRTRRRFARMYGARSSLTKPRFCEGSSERSPTVLVAARSRGR
jgi:hypothetical protein